jgi:hypothetical protein
MMATTIISSIRVNPRFISTPSFGQKKGGGLV